MLIWNYKVAIVALALLTIGVMARGVELNAVVSEPGKTEKAEKKMFLVNINKGELPNDNNGKVALSLSEENVAQKGDLSLKVVWTGGGAFGMLNPKNSNWGDFNFIKFTVFNAGKDIVSLSFSARDDNPVKGYASRFDTTVALPPGKSTQEIAIQGVSNNSGGSFNIKKITHWYIAGPTAETTLFFSDMVLTTSDK